MKTFKTISILGIIVLLSACGEPVQKVVTKIDSLTLKPVPSDTSVSDLEKPDSDSEKTPPIEKEVEVNEGIVYYTLPYCGGARPSEEIIAEKKKSRLLTNSTLKMKNKAGVEYLVVTNDKGIFRSGIPAGQYDVYLTEKTNKAIYNVSPETCENCLTKPTGNVIIRKGQQASFTIHFNCGPNDKWRP